MTVRAGQTWTLKIDPEDEGSLYLILGVTEGRAEMWCIEDQYRTWDAVSMMTPVDGWTLFCEEAP